MAFQSTKPVVLYSVPTPNGIPITALLEELKEAYGIPDYDVVKMSISDADIGKVHNQVKSPWFLEINPNGRIPAITHEGFPVFETSAILLYLAAVYDKDSKFSWDPIKDPKEYSEQLQWIFFAHGGVGPMQGQANHFVRYAPEKIPYAMNRYKNETRRLYSVLETRLSNGREYLAGAGAGKFSLADIKTWAWVKFCHFLEIDLATEFPNVKVWVDKIDARSGVKKGMEAHPK